MEILALIALAAGVALSVWGYYVLTNLAIAVWLPKKSNKKWLEILNHPFIHYWRPFIKWIVPLCLFMVFISLVLQIVLLVLKS